MRDPRPQDFDPKTRQRTPDDVDLSGVVPLQPKPGVASLTGETVISQTVPTSQKHQDSRVVSRQRGGMVSRHHDTTAFSSIMASEHSVIQWVRKAVKEFGKEAATHRFTSAEKQTIAQIVFAYRGRGIRTSENELARIAINALFYDYQQNGDHSILHKSLISLNE